jgi:hypothetical protein
MSRHLSTWIACLVLAVLPASGANAAANRNGDCFLSNQWQGWSAPGDGDVLLLRVFLHDIWKVELTPGTRVHRFPDYFLVNEVRGSPWICSPLDLDLTLADRNGYRQPLIARSLRRLTPEEVAVIPRKDLPY